MAPSDAKSTGDQPSKSQTTMAGSCGNPHLPKSGPSQMSPQSPASQCWRSPTCLYPSLMLLLPKRQFFHSVPGPLLGAFYSDLRNHHLEAKLLSWRAIWKGSPQGECNSLSLPCTPCDIWLSNVVCSMLRLQSTTIK